MFSQEIKNKLIDLANKGNFKECENLIDRYRLPYDIGKDIYNILEYIYENRQRFDLATEFNKLGSNPEYYNKFFDIGFPTSSKKIITEGKSKRETLKYKEFFDGQVELLNAEKKAQEHELKAALNKNFVFLSDNEFALIDIDNFEGPYLYDEDIFEEKVEKWKVRFILKEKHKRIIDTLKFKVNGTVFIYCDDIDIEYNTKIFKVPAKTKAIIDEVNKEQISLLIDKATSEDIKKNKNKHKKYSLVLWVDETTYKIQKEALTKLSNGEVINRHILEILANAALPRDDCPEKISKFLQKLNKYQQECVNNSFKNRDFFLIHGPPGTGKTKVCSEIAIQKILKKPDSKILICADSNEATDNILESVSNIVPKEFYIRMLRVGSIPKISPDNKKFMLTYQKDNHPLQVHIDKIMNENKELLRLRRKYVRESKIEFYLTSYEQLQMEKIKKELLLTASQPSNVALNTYFNYAIIKGFDKSREWKKFVGFLKDKGMKTNLKDDLFFISLDTKELDLIKIIDEFMEDSKYELSKIENLKMLERQLMGVIHEINRLVKKRDKGLLGPYGQEKLEMYEKTREGLLKCISENTLRRINEINEKIKDNNLSIIQLKKQIYYEIMFSANIIFCTNTVSGKKILTETLKTTSFDLTIIDEATQSTLFSTYVPLIKSKKVVMAGDHHQLPPTVNLKNFISGETKEESEKRRKLAKQLEITLFERLFERFKDEKLNATYPLKTQYRMNPSIIDFINTHFYKDCLLDSDASCEGRGIDLIFKPPLVSIDVKGKEVKCGHSYLNYIEANTILLLLNKFQQLGYSNFDEIGVITPYAAQVELLNNKLRKFGVVARTVDGFQGQEKDIIIISLVRTDINKLKVKTEEQKKEHKERTGREYDEIRSTIGFLSDIRRLNVMITRFRKKLIIIGDMETLSRFDSDPNDPTNKILYKKLFDYVGEHGQIIGTRQELNRILESATSILDREPKTSEIEKLSQDYGLLANELITGIRFPYSFNLLINSEDKLKNTFTKKYYSDEEDYNSLVKINLKEGMEDNLKTIYLEENKEVIRDWNYWDNDEKRREVLSKSIEENGKLTVKAVLKLIYKSSPLDLQIRRIARRDLVWIDKEEILEEEKEKIEKIDEKSVEKQKRITPEIKQIITDPDDREGNFIKIQEMIFDQLQNTALIVDMQIRFVGLKNLYKHLRISKELNKLDMLTSEEALKDLNIGNATLEYGKKIKEYSSKLGYPLIVKIADENNSKSMHGRFIYCQNMGWSIGQGLNILHTRKDLICELDQNIVNEEYKKDLQLFNNSLDLILNLYVIKRKIDSILFRNPTPKERKSQIIS